LLRVIALAYNTAENEGEWYLMVVEVERNGKTYSE